MGRVIDIALLTVAAVTLFVRHVEPYRIWAGLFWVAFGAHMLVRLAVWREPRGREFETSMVGIAFLGFGVTGIWPVGKWDSLPFVFLAAVVVRRL